MTGPHVPAAPATDPTFTPPSLGRRFGALIIDWVLCLLVANIFADPVRDGWAPVLVLILEYGIFLGLFAQTPGMYITKVRCVNWHDGGRIGLPRALARGVLLALVVPALIMDEHRRGVHDRLVDSVIVDAPRG
ncbi:RDD family protein [Micromonospora lupini]|uniref:RDD family protein n=1 Tax=Micromonospora lupini TaxID=285679 RepID=UPI002255161C|nr:RDD family protein [Micromonospora lupini]MCX5066504.1 RDD family protein [Micromonospora lupini]